MKMLLSRLGTRWAAGQRISILLLILIVSLIGCTMAGKRRMFAVSEASASKDLPASLSLAAAGVSVGREAENLQMRKGTAAVDTIGGLSAASVVPASVSVSAENNTASTGQQTPGETAGQSPTAKRQMVYTADMGLRVANKTVARKEIDDLIVRMNGFMQSASLDMVCFKVPPEFFQQTMDALEAMGEVTYRNVRAEDVTEQFTDLNLRIDVAEKSRQRLLALLEKVNETTAVLEVERDIRRLTEEIEGLKGKLRVLSAQIAYATITIKLEEKVVEQTTHRRPMGPRFEWMSRIGIEHVLRQVPTRASIDGPALWRKAVFGAPFRLDAPKGKVAPEDFVVLLYTKDELIATTPEDYRMRAWRIKTRQKADLLFWTRAIAEELSQNRGYDVKKPEPFGLKVKNLKAMSLKSETAFNGERWNYDLWVIQDSGDLEDVVVVEYARSTKDAEKQREEVEKAVKGLRF